ncbi:hypothetical protein BGW38_001805 [Lunasporangiospora selenospora]|uniref:glucan endo-1,3-beta-D-glucosidase n=1 Tax=Lunasporangiospora selenospora TaxID=979761 RepID=A0A9P6FT82_9FUNG|nr:hypothetical protein BGW38_001805 [Lunasporangiospora selenospora]
MPFTPVPSSTASVTTGPMAPSAPSSVFGSLFKQKHHKRKTSSVLGWDSDDDEEVDRAQAEALGGSPAQQPVSYNEKSHWLRKQDRKQKNMRNCLCLGVILCFLILGTILAFTFKEQIFHKPRTVSRPGQNGPDAESDALLQKNHGSIESTFHVNKTIAPNPLLSKVFYGIDYTPSGAQEPDCHVNLGSVIEDIKVLSQLTTRIRLYGMACRQAEYVLRAIEYLGLQEMFVILTLWVDHDPVTWQKQTRSFWSLLDTDALMDQGDLGYINDIRRGISDRAAIAASATAGDPVMQALAQHLGQLPVFSSDLGRNAHQLVNSVDWVLSNIHPFFAYQSADRAADWAFTNFKGETQKVAATKPAIISEVGWPSGPATANLGPAVPSLENLQVFVDTWVCQANSRNIPYYFFEAFDEPWKNAINPRESQWGLMTADRKLKIRVPLCT